MQPTGTKKPQPAPQTSSTGSILESPLPLPFGLELCFGSQGYTMAVWLMEWSLTEGNAILLSTQAISTLGLPSPNC